MATFEVLCVPFDMPVPIPALRVVGGCRRGTVDLTPAASRVIA